MTKAKETTIRKKLPKKLRFSGFFLRRLMPFLLLAAFFFTTSVIKDYHTADNFSFTGELTDQSGWLSYSALLLEDSSIWELKESEWIPGILRKLSQPNVIQSYTDLALMAFQPETCEITCSKPAAGIRVDYTENKGDSFTADYYYASDAEAEKLMQDMQTYSDAHHLRFSLFQRAAQDRIFGYPGLDFDWEWFFPRAVPLRAQIKLHQFKGLEYAWLGSSGEVLSSAETIPADFGSTAVNPLYKIENGRASRDKSRAAWDLPANAIILNGLTVYGSPSDCRAAAITQEAADRMGVYRKLLSDTRQVIEDIAQDETGTALEQYYKKEKKEARYRTILNGGKESSVPSPAEKLEQLTERSLYGAEDEAHEIIKELEKDPENRWIRYYTTTQCFTLPDDTRFSVLAVQTLDMRKYLLSGIIFYFIKYLILALIPALIWTILFYPKARRRCDADEYRRTVTAALAHDLKSPLTAISGYAENLDSGVHPEKQKHYTASILENARYMDSIITQSLELSRMEKDLVAKKQWVDLIPIMQEQLGHRQDELSERGIKAQITGSCFFYADPRMMLQAVRNLLDNAVKFTPDGGSITVTGEGRAMRVVNDINAEKVERINEVCEAFVKGDSARSNRKGTGLGLSVVRQSAELNKLRFRVQSSGHTFTALLRDKPLLFRRIRFGKIKPL